MEKLTKKSYIDHKSVFTKQENIQVNGIYPFNFFKKKLLKIEIN